LSGFGVPKEVLDETDRMATGDTEDLSVLRTFGMGTWHLIKAFAE
jgi:hypothetical protein